MDKPGLRPLRDLDTADLRADFPGVDA